MCILSLSVSILATAMFLEQALAIFEQEHGALSYLLTNLLETIGMCLAAATFSSIYMFTVAFKYSMFFFI